MPIWQPPENCGGAPTVAASPGSAATALWAANDRVYFGTGAVSGILPVKSSTASVSVITAGGPPTPVWTGPGVPLGGALISDHLFIGSYGPRDGYIFDTSISAQQPLSEGFWGMGAGFSSFATADAWYWMEGETDFAEMFRVDLAGNVTSLGTVTNGDALTVIGSRLFWLSGDINEVSAAGAAQASPLLTVPRSTKLWDMTTDGTRLFVIAGPNIVSVDTTGAFRCLLQLTGPNHLAYAAGQLFIAESSFGRITALDPQTQTPTCFTTSAGYVDAMAADSGALYWLDRTGQSVKTQAFTTTAAAATGRQPM